MKKLFSALTLLFVITAAFADAQFTPQEISITVQAEPQPNEYVMVITGCDWGPAITKLVLNLGHNVSSDAVFIEDFEVAVTLNKRQKDSNKLGFGVVTGSLQVTNAYISDANGERLQAPASHSLALEIASAPWLTDGDPFFHFPQAKNMSSVCGLRIKAQSLNITINDRTAIVSPLAGQFTTAVFSDDYVSLNYAWWLPPNVGTAMATVAAATGAAVTVNAATPTASEPAPTAASNGAAAQKIPLIVWFHGLGEDGTNPYQPLFGTKSTNLITDTVQRYFPQGAAVLVPQSPTSWLETTTRDLLGNRIWAPADTQAVKDKMLQPVRNFFGKLFTSGSANDSRKEPTATVSYYTPTIKALLAAFLDAHPEIDRDRVYVGGCSAGGYMTVNMCLQAPELFAAAFPTCEVFPDSKITDAQINALATMPLWFTHAKNDTTVKPEAHDQATVARLRNEHARDLHFTLWDDVRDLTGTYEQPPEDEDDPPTGEPYQFGGHYSWIYVLNNACEDNGVTLFEWLSQQRRN